MRAARAGPARPKVHRVRAARPRLARRLGVLRRQRDLVHRLGAPTHCARARPSAHRVHVAQVFRFNAEVATAMLDPYPLTAPTGGTGGAAPVLTILQVVSTLPSPPPPVSNTCGRIAIHPLGRHVLVSNRGDDSIASFRIERSADGESTLAMVGVYPTGGQTPRHFQFAAGGRFVVAANQDTDSLTVLAFSASDGALSPTGHSLALRECRRAARPLQLPHDTPRRLARRAAPLTLGHAMWQPRPTSCARRRGVSTRCASQSPSRAPPSSPDSIAPPDERQRRRRRSARHRSSAIT